jgi:hypothetical protein
MFRKNDLELHIFNRKVFIFFHQKCFLTKIECLSRKKIEKRNLSKKVDGSLRIHPYIQWLQKLSIQQHTLLFLCQTLGKEESERTAVSTVMFSIVSSLPVHILRQKFPSCDRRLKKQTSSLILVLPKIVHTVGEKVVPSTTQLQG